MSSLKEILDELEPTMMDAIRASLTDSLPIDVQVRSALVRRLWLMPAEKLQWLSDTMDALDQGSAIKIITVEPLRVAGRCRNYPTLRY